MGGSKITTIDFVFYCGIVFCPSFVFSKSSKANLQHRPLMKFSRALLYSILVLYRNNGIL